MAGERAGRVGATAISGNALVASMGQVSHGPAPATQQLRCMRAGRHSRIWIRHLALGALAACARSRAQDAVVTPAAACVPPLSRESEPELWTPLPPPIDSIDFRVYWSEDFLVYEIVFRNRSTRRVHLEYATTSRGAATAPLTREIAPSVAESPPGATVPGAMTGRPVCVRVLTAWPVPAARPASYESYESYEWDERPSSRASGQR